MKCPKCETLNPHDSKFCKECATQLTTTGIIYSKTGTLHAPTRELTTGATFAGRYQIVEELGKGGMGRVYRAIDVRLDEEIALKLIKPEFTSDKMMLERFHNELKLARKISHKHVGRVFDLNEDKGTYYITMEYVRGQDLRGLLRQSRQLTIRTAIALAAQICEGLVEAHRLGIIHRDLKPSNIIIDDEGNARIMDFGIARSLAGGGLTADGAMIGTPEYMSPEQVDCGDIDGRADIYALGVILFEMLTGGVPFTGDTPIGVALKQKSAGVPDPTKHNPQIPPTLKSIVMKCLEKDRGRRYSSAAELCGELAKVQSNLSPTGAWAPPRRKGAMVSRSFRWPEKYAAALAGLGLLILAVLLIPVIFRPGPVQYESLVIMEWLAPRSAEIQQDLVTQLVQRGLEASTRMNVIVGGDLIVYKARTNTVEKTPRKPLMTITGEVLPKAAGFEISLTTRFRDKPAHRLFECKGYLDLLGVQADQIFAFICAQSDRMVGEIEGERTIAQILTSNLDALTHFVKGEEAWAKLEFEPALHEYRAALETDRSFSLAHLRLAEVLLFRKDLESAEKSLKEAQGGDSHLIEHDRLKLKALLARVNFRPSEERQYFRMLAEEFPFKKEYQYELAESYFHSGDAEEAIKHYSQALSLDPSFAKAHNHIAYCYAWTGDHGKAEEHFKRYVELDHTANSYDSLADGYLFSGRYEELVEAVKEGLRLGPNLDYLWKTLAKVRILQGHLAEALEAADQERKFSSLVNTKMAADFNRAYIEFMRGNSETCLARLRPVLETCSREPYSIQLDEIPNAPLWLAGVLAAQKNDLAGLRDMLTRMEDKMRRRDVNASNYFPVYKFFLHLKVLECSLLGDTGGVLRHIDDMKRIWRKMGYHDSMYDSSFFLDAAAKVLLDRGLADEAQGLLKQTLVYNPSSVPARVHFAQALLEKGEIENAQAEYQKAEKALADADGDWIVAKEAGRIKARLTSGPTSPVAQSSFRTP
jgi:tetratricopeptide (TPR) repeat protein/predicted Ser/Thr protein kinase